ncbi:6-bladed beta-propeller [Cytophagaceae bacterium DM2B3-1]|uniref:6-bladed beta-propeller n=1 Tax=Xanthocytophaga flava TaxID=3048013 RepID=A0ABT7CTW1_9BACT|nr:6-bladed beta-propeller [Xanthocytophaga flavus]MDJ1496941.1 6-bladed beta-propeller [Xanthocytophaga flavus]
MIKTLPRVILFLLLSIGLTSEVWAQQYTFKRTVGKTGASRPSDIAMDINGAIYVASEDRSIMKLGADSRFLFMVGSFGSRVDVFGGTNHIATDAQGNLWVADSYKSVIQKFDSKGSLLFQFGSKGTGNGQLSNPTAIFVDIQGNIWVTDESNRLQKFDATGKFLLKTGSGGSADGQFMSASGITVDTQGNVWVADSYAHRIQKFNSSGKFLLKVGSEGSGNGQFNHPWSVAVDSKGNVWVLDNGNGRIQKFDGNGKFLLTSGEVGSNDGQLANPKGMIIDKQDNIWVADCSNNRVQRFGTDGKFLSKFASPASDNGSYKYPAGVTVDNSGNTWVVDEGNHRIQKFDPDGNFLSTFGSLGMADTQLNYPQDLTLDRQGNVWITNSGNQKIKKFDATGNFLFAFGEKGTGNGQFISPQGICIDRQDNIWISDRNNHCVQKFDKNGNFLLKIGSSQGSADGQFDQPQGINVDSKGNIWVVDNNNNRLQKFSSDGKFLLKLNSNGAGDGQLNYPSDVAVDNEDNIWITDVQNRRIQKFDPTGKFLSKIDLLSISMQPYAIAIDKEGDVYWTNSTLGVMVYSTDQVAFINGTIYSDANLNCKFDASDKPLPGIIVKTEPGDYFGVTDREGNYRIAVPLGTYTVSQILNTDNVLLQPVCPVNNISTSVTLSSKGERVSNINFGNTVTAIPHLTIAVSSDRRRRCFSSQTVVTFSNTGYADAQDVKVYVKMPENVILQTADKPFTITPDSSYVFSIGTLGANQTSTIQITDSVACIADITGLTACTKVWITPANDYTLSENSTWDNSDIALIGKCVENGRVQMVIKNMGQAMADSAEFRILLNAQLALRKNYKLEAGDSLVLRIPANGKTVRLEANQRPDHPRKSQTNLTIEGCKSSISDVVSKGFVDALPQDDAEPEVAVECLPIIDSFDPNDKLVSPVGTPNDHYTPTNTELKYTIRFQNTGTDYAYTVTVVDTLSESLDISTLQMGSSSHMYSLKVTGKGRPVLTWTFNTINLPDSTRDQAGSNGFVQFTIKPKANLAEKAQIENFADIFFDYNDPVRTNTTANVLYDVPPVITQQNQLSENGVIFLPPTISSFTPETAQIGEQITITGTNYQTILTDNTVTINGKKATVVSATETQLVVTIPTGVTAGKVSVTTLGGTATSETEFVMKPTATEQPEWSRSIVISPNPSDGRFTIDFSKASTRIQNIDVYNNLGQKMYTQAVSQSSYQKELDLSGNGVGIYLAVFKTDKGNATRKVIVK